MSGCLHSQRKRERLTPLGHESAQVAQRTGQRAKALVLSVRNCKAEARMSAVRAAAVMPESVEVRRSLNPLGTCKQAGNLGKQASDVHRHRSSCSRFPGRLHDGGRAMEIDPRALDELFGRLPSPSAVRGCFFFFFQSSLRRKFVMASTSLHLGWDFLLFFLPQPFLSRALSARNLAPERPSLLHLAGSAAPTTWLGPEDREP
jgi:hypothetical protein